MIMLIDKIVSWFTVVKIYFPWIPSCSSLKTVISLQFPYTGGPQITIKARNYGQKVIVVIKHIT